MYFSVLQPNITKEFIFSKGINQESIMQYYTGLNVNSKKLALSPFRSDSRVTVGIYKSKSGILYLHDFATNEHINCFQAVMKLYNCNYYKALEIIAKDFGLIEGTKSKPFSPKKIESIKQNETCNIQVQIKDFTDKELEWWKQFGIDKKLLKKYHVYSILHVFLNGELKFTSSEKCPIYGYYFGKSKKELWKIYLPANKEKGVRFLNNLPNKKLQGYKQLPEKSNLLVITKSMKDCIAMYSFGINAVAPSSESTFINDKQLEEFKSRFKHILVIYDQDKAGKHNMYKIRASYPELNYFVLPKKLNCKDFSDLVQMYGVEKVKEFINQFMLNYKFK